MAESKKYNRKLEINDLIDDAINNAVARRGLVETLSDDEAKRIGGGLSLSPAIAGYKPICPPTQPIIKPIEPVCLPTKPIEPFYPPIKICPPIIVGLIAVPLDAKKITF
ncbi:hypothetical protein ACP6PL_06445 [Dapis sp. BLCC M126]|uniref:hypothetical protein n=1 Tax=Dapis sp. BLCC M126 TaxID=3400189 RepID=UPI003CFB2E56